MTSLSGESAPQNMPLTIGDGAENFMLQRNINAILAWDFVSPLRHGGVVAKFSVYPTAEKSSFP